MPLLGNAKHRLGDGLGSGATTGEGTQNLLCAYLAAGVLASLALNATLGLWWADPAVALGIAALAVKEGHQTWQGEGCWATPPTNGENNTGSATTSAAADCRDRAQPGGRPADAHRSLSATTKCGPRLGLTSAITSATRGRTHQVNPRGWRFG